VESPAHLLRELRLLIEPGGYLLVTTPNVECVQARLRFLIDGTLRAFESFGDPTHITPQFTSLFPRLAARSGWRIEDRIPLLTKASRPVVQMMCRALRPILKGATVGDAHLYVLRPVT
jgi:2-polyprenyl-3-methyl-5-hydroxy-6-metoxy-1,4-benzoquinol methylase